MSWAHSLLNLPIPENLVITWPYTDRPSAPQDNQCLLSHFLTTLGAQEETDCTWMLWSIDSCQNKVFADQYHLTVWRAQVLTHRDRVLFWSYPLTSYWFSNDRRLKFIFLKFIWNMLCLCHDGPALLRFWFQTNHGRENSASYLKIQAGRPFLTQLTRCHTLRPIFMLWLVKIWQMSICGKYMQHLEACLLWQLKLAEFCVNLWCF